MSAFSPLPSTTPQLVTPLPLFYPPPWFCPCVLYSSSCKSLSPLSPPHSPLAIVRLLLTSMSLVIFSLLFSFVDYYRNCHVYFFTDLNWVNCDVYLPCSTQPRILIHKWFTWECTHFVLVRLSLIVSFPDFSIKLSATIGIHQVFSLS